MAEPDLLASIIEQLRERLEHLRPLVAEHQRLQAADQALGTSTAPVPPPKRGRRGASPKPHSAGNSGDRDAARERLLAIIGERPGVTKGELQSASKLSGASVAQQIRRLRDRAEIAETQLPGGDVGYRLASAGASTAAP